MGNSIDPEATESFIKDLVKIDDYFSNPANLEDKCLKGFDADKYKISPSAIDFKVQGMVDFYEWGTAESRPDTTLAVCFALIKSGYVDKASEAEQQKAADFVGKFLDTCAAAQKVPYIPCGNTISHLVKYRPELYKVVAALMKHNEKKLQNPDFEKDEKYPTDFSSFLTASLGYVSSMYEAQPVITRHPLTQDEKDLDKAIEDWRLDWQNTSCAPPASLLNTYVAHYSKIFKLQDALCRIIFDSELVQQLVHDKYEDLGSNFIHFLCSGAVGTLFPLEKPKEVIPKHIVLLRNAAAPQLAQVRYHIFAELFRFVVSSGKFQEESLLARRNGYFWDGGSTDSNKLIKADLSYARNGFKYKLNSLMLSVAQGHPLICKEICAIIVSSKLDWEKVITDETTGLASEKNLLEVACFEPVLEYRARHGPGRDIDQDAADIVETLLSVPHVKALKDGFKKGIGKRVDSYIDAYPKLKATLKANDLI